MEQEPDHRPTDETWGTDEPQDPRFADPKASRTPGRPVRPDPPSQRARGFPWTVLLALVAAGLFFLLLVLLSQGMLLPLALVGGGLFAVVTLHYLLWGWWLSGAIHREVEEEDRQARDE